MRTSTSNRSGRSLTQCQRRTRKNPDQRVTPGVVDRTFRALCMGLDTPVSLGAWLRFKYGEHEQLARIEVRPEHYHTAAAFEVDYLVASFLSKYQGLKTGIDTKEVAVAAFRKAEEQCRATNHRLRQGRIRGYSPRVDAVLFMAQRKIASLLGPVSDAWQSMCGWGPGATLDLNQQEATLDNKIGVTPISVTYGARDLLKAVIESDRHWMSAICEADCDGPASLLPGCFTIVPGGKFATVPKNAKTDRSILVEPTGNIFLQKGVGGFFRRRLRRVGIDLDNQLTNRNLAWLGSLNGVLATLDLKAASDTVSIELVFELLPVDWAMLLAQLRSPKARINGEWIGLEKFSSMGNGFTFELETLIFWALAQACSAYLGSLEPVAVYGDDVIVDSDVVPHLREVYEHCGFSLNKEKSFASGPFRESCGGHYWSGYDVTPIYQKEVVDTVASVYRLANRLRRLAVKLGGGDHADRRILGAWSESTRCGVDIRHFLPDGEEGDDGLLVPRDEFVLKSSVRRKHWIWQSRVLQFVPKRREARTHRSLLAYSLRFEPNEPFYGQVTLRRIGTYRERSRNVSLGTRNVAWQ